MMAGIQCDVVVLTWNHLELTRKFFDSLLSSTGPMIRIIVVDNGSADGTKEYLKELKTRPGLIHKIDVVFNEENVGFVRGVNQGFALSTAPYVCLANNDLIFTDGWLDEILLLFVKYASIGILNPNSNTLGTRFLEAMPLKDFSADLRSKLSGNFVEMPFCSGFCMVLRRDILDKNKGLSQEYIPMFFEDTDISMKAKEMGYLIGVAKGAYVWHREHGSFKQGSEIEKVFQRSRQVFEKKWGKTLRIALIEDNYNDCLGDLRRAMKSKARENFVTFYVKGSDVQREDVFKKLGIFEHSAIQFKKFHVYSGLIFTIALKKKKFDLIIARNKFVRFMFCVAGQRTASGFRAGLIDELKKVA